MMKWIKRLMVALISIFAICMVVSGIERIRGKSGWTGRHAPRGMYERAFKRPLDILFVVMVLLVIWPLVLVLAMLVRLRLGSPILFKQERPGLDTKKFIIYKFRSMTNECDSEGNLLPDELRLSRFGKWLRRTSLDELPELINILKGDMSLVGPRPLLDRYLPYYTERENRRHDVRPGLTGLAQIHGRNLVSWDERLSLDVLYSENITFWGDIKILFKTLGSVLSKDGVAGNAYDVETLLDVERVESKRYDYE